MFFKRSIMSNGDLPVFSFLSLFVLLIVVLTFDPQPGHQSPAYLSSIQLQDVGIFIRGTRLQSLIWGV